MEVDDVEMVADVVLNRLEYEEHACMGREIAIRGEMEDHTLFVEAMYYKPILFHLFHVRRFYQTTFRLGDE